MTETIIHCVELHELEEQLVRMGEEGWTFKSQTQVLITKRGPDGREFQEICYDLHFFKEEAE